MISITTKVGLAGAHSTGKTTLLDCLEHRLTADGLVVKRVADLASEARESGFPILRQHTFESTLWIMTRGINLELEAARKSDVVLVDRPVLDAFGYLLAALRSRADSLVDWEDAYLRTLIKIHTPTYDVLLATEIDPSIPIDTTKERDTDPAFRVMAQDGIMEAFTISGCAPFPVYASRSNETLEIVVSKIREAVARKQSR